MTIEELYDLELKYQEFYNRTKDYTRNDFVLELIKKDDEKQELIDYLQEQIKRCEKNIKIHSKEISKLVDVKNHNRHVILRVRIKMAKQVYEEILSKIEKG